MTADIIPLNAFAGASNDAARQQRDQKHDHEHQKRQEEQTRLDRLKLRELLSAKGKGPVFTRPSDQIIAAQAVGDLVRKTKREFEDVTIEKIKDRLRSMAAPGKKPGTDRINRYMLASKLSSDEAKKLSPDDAKRLTKKLQQRVLGYMDIAEIIAELTSRNRDDLKDDLKIEILKETTLWLGHSTKTAIEDPRASHLAILMREMSRQVIRITKVAELFQRARRIPGVWDLSLECFKPSTMACLFQSAYLDRFEHYTESPPLPSVPLVRCAHAEFFAQVRFEREAVPSVRTDESAFSKNFVGDERYASFRLQREIRLALGPTTGPEAIGPMLESRAHVELWFDKNPDSAFALHPNLTLKPEDDIFHSISACVFQVLLEDGWHRVLPLTPLDECEGLALNPGDDPSMWSPNPLDPRPNPGSRTVEHWYLSWTSLNEETVRFWLDRRRDNRTFVCVPREAIRRAPGTQWYARPAAAYEIEEAVGTGALETALVAAVERMRSALGVREKVWRKDATTTASLLLETWQQSEGMKQ